MPKDGNKTRTKILDETTQLVLTNGFAGTTIDHILAKTELTKGAFFYHFKSKSELAMELMRHFAMHDMGELKGALEGTIEYENDPAKRLSMFIQWFIDIFDGLDSPYAGCLYASYTYEPEQFGQEVMDMVVEAVYLWRKTLVALINEVSRIKKPSIEIDVDSLADMFTVILEGAFIVSKVLKDPKITVNQLIHYKNYLELIY
ncbi:TetR/AcrR family transcriptional regulator [Marinoscillum sp. MHG1-6]|uniref:TetR/AcrR family transcriptional regulator n=1 Tax=Marinoscillum sp. MHG1-6 TaxID=2959627 RepID=UPI0021570810|nr:TetR/AcrR family transcriptional regulator [Marinoscillum sp. MHG1-6]